MPNQEKPKDSPSRRRTSKQPTPKNKLDNLKKEAKRWLKDLLAGDSQALERFNRAYPDTPAKPSLRHVQHAMARERGFAGWATLKSQLVDQALSKQVDDHTTEKEKVELVNLFLEYACADPILNNGPAAHARRARAALRILTRHPWIARVNIHTAVVCGDLDEVERILEERPQAATDPGGPQRRRHLSDLEKLWTPLLHLCYGRLPLPAAGDNALAIARALLDAGADPNDYFEVGSFPCRYTTLCGVAGEGEDDAPPHPQREALARLLLERGARPYDTQLFYNTHFHSDILWLMELVYEFSVKAGRQADWEDPDWSMIDLGGYDFGARYLLLNAIRKNDPALVEWLLTHGASPNAMPKPNSKFPMRTLHQEAVREGHTDIADLLVRFGAAPSGAAELDGLEEFTAACFRLDRERAQALLAEHPEYRDSPNPIFAAARRDRADVVEFLLDLGAPIEVEDASKQRPLHEAASHDSINVAKLLIDRGAEIEPVETNWNNKPLDHAMYGNLGRMVEFLSRFTRDVYRLTWIGNVERLREVLSEEPELAKAADEGNTPLMWMPEDESRGKEIAELLIAHGADPAIKNKDGMTAADCAERRGLYDVAELLRTRERIPR